MFGDGIGMLYDEVGVGQPCPEDMVERNGAWEEGFCMSVSVVVAHVKKSIKHTSTWYETTVPGISESHLSVSQSVREMGIGRTDIKVFTQYYQRICAYGQGDASSHCEGPFCRCC